MTHLMKFFHCITPEKVERIVVHDFIAIFSNPHSVTTEFLAITLFLSTQTKPLVGTLQY